MTNQTKRRSNTPELRPISSDTVATAASGSAVSGMPTNVRGRARRSSSVGNINVGDTVPSLSTMASSKKSRLASRKRLASLSEHTENTDEDLLKKFRLSYREISYRHTWLTPLLILIVVFSIYLSSANFTESNWLHQFVAISYFDPETGKYGKGIKDLSFIFFYMIFFSFFRDFLMEVILKPFSIYIGVQKPSKVKRMMEQCYSVVYYGISGPCGLAIMYHTPMWLFETKPMYASYPDLQLEFYMKLFYLTQASFWTQQACVLVLQLEKPRKDFKELVFHHIVTLSLIWASYVFHFTNMGLIIYITMDVSDLFLSLSKIFNYLESAWTAPFFGSFVISWIYLRHYVNIKVLWSLFTEFKTSGPYILDFAQQQYKCWISLPFVFVLISALQLVNLYWLFLILRILYRYVFKGVQKDDRSDSEDESDLEEEDKINQEKIMTSSRTSPNTFKREN
ncbi:sphingosine N-acyltransferase lag1 [Hanseniaspora osmophila]